MTRLPTASEHAIHVSVAQHLRLRAVPNCCWWHTPNGGFRNRIEAARFTALGVRPGIPDLLFLRPGAPLRGLELKRKGGRLSKAQEVCHPAMRAAGAEVAVADNIDEALAILAGWGLLR